MQEEKEAALVIKAANGGSAPGAVVPRAPLETEDESSLEFEIDIFD